MAATLASLDLPECHAAPMIALGPRRLSLYRKQVFRRMRAAIRSALPQTCVRLGSRLDESVELFIDSPDLGPRSRHMFHLPTEFVQWGTPRWNGEESYPRFLSDLARHEACRFALWRVPGGGETNSGSPIALALPVHLDATSVVVHYGFAVHKLPVNAPLEREPQRRETYLLGYRDVATGKPRFLNLSKRSAKLIEELQAGETLQHAITQACNHAGSEIDTETLDAIANLLGTLGEKKVILGAKIDFTEGLPSDPKGD